MTKAFRIHLRLSCERYFLIWLIDRIARIVFLQMSLTCCFRRSSLSNVTPKLRTLSDRSIVVLPNENQVRTGCCAKREVFYQGCNRVDNILGEQLKQT